MVIIRAIIVVILTVPIRAIIKGSNKVIIRVTIG